MSEAESTETGPIDYVPVEWTNRQPNGAAIPHLLDLVDRGIIRIPDLAFIVKDAEGNAAGVGLAELEVGSELDELARRQLGADRSGGGPDPGPGGARSARSRGSGLERRPECQVY